MNTQAEIIGVIVVNVVVIGGIGYLGRDAFKAIWQQVSDRNSLFIPLAWVFVLGPLLLWWLEK